MKIAKIIVAVFLVLFTLGIVSSSMGTVESGTKWVKYQYWVATNIIDEGIYFTMPIVSYVKVYDVRTQKIDVTAGASSKDLQTVTVDAAVNFWVEPEKLITIVKTIWDWYVDKILSPAIQESIKSTTAKYTAEELITKREEVRQNIQKGLDEKMLGTGIKVSGINITNLEFSPSFNAAIEAKVTAEQQALAQKNMLERTKYEWEQKVVAAKAEAESIRIQAESISKQGWAEFVQLKAIEKWNGSVPTTMLWDSIPFVNIK